MVHNRTTENQREATAPIHTQHLEEGIVLSFSTHAIRKQTNTQKGKNEHFMWQKQQCIAGTHMRIRREDEQVNTQLWPFPTTDTGWRTSNAIGQENTAGWEHSKQRARGCISSQKDEQWTQITDTCDNIGSERDKQEYKEDVRSMNTHTHTYTIKCITAIHYHKWKWPLNDGCDREASKQWLETTRCPQRNAHVRNEHTPSFLGIRAHTYPCTPSVVRDVKWFWQATFVSEPVKEWRFVFVYVYHKKGVDQRPFKTQSVPRCSSACKSIHPHAQRVKTNRTAHLACKETRSGIGGREKTSSMGTFPPMPEKFFWRSIFGRRKNRKNKLFPNRKKQFWIKKPETK